MSKKQKYAGNKHYWKYKLRNGRTVRKAALVIYAEEPVSADLTADHVRESIRLKGVGDTQTCSMAICCTSQAGRFPHRVTGDVEWYYSRAFVGSKLDADGFVAECYVYGHHDNIAKFQDTKAGQQKLLAELLRDGDRTVNLMPLSKVQRGSHPLGTAHRDSAHDGSRTKRYKGTRARAAHVMASA